MKRVAEILAAIASKDVQRYQVRVARVDEECEIINVVAVVDCLDTERLDITWCEDGDDIRPELAARHGS